MEYKSKIFLIKYVVLHVHISSSTEGTLKIKSPDPETYFKNRDHLHTFRGIFYGIIVLIGTLVSIGWFITWTLAGTDLVNNFDI